MHKLIGDVTLDVGCSLADDFGGSYQKLLIIVNPLRLALMSNYVNYNI
jgi:hypothetical protein